MSIYRPIWQERAVDGPFEFWGLHDEDGTLRVALRGKSTLLNVFFDSYLVFRKYDEGDGLRTLDQVSETGGLGRWFYIVEQSEMLDWFNRESLGIRAHRELTHYALLCSNDIIDIISPEPPRIEVVEGGADAS